MAEDYPPVPDPSTFWELRFTARALDDLKAPKAEPGDMPAVRTATTWSGIVDEFTTQRSLSPHSTQGTLHSVGRGDIAALHGGAGGRACTWFDANDGVCWLLGFTPAHNYDLFETRAGYGELMPSEDDEVALELARENREFDTRVRPGAETLARQAMAEPGTCKRGTTGGDLLRMEVSTEMVVIGGTTMCDLYVAIKLPLSETRTAVPGWPGDQLGTELAGLLRGDLDHTGDMPDGAGGFRAIDHQNEMVLKICNVSLD